MVPRTPSGLIGLTVGPAAGLMFDAAVIACGELDWPRPEAFAAPAGSGLPSWVFEFGPGFVGTGTDGSLGTLPKLRSTRFRAGFLVPLPRDFDFGALVATAGFSSFRAAVPTAALCC